MVYNTTGTVGTVYNSTSNNSNMSSVGAPPHQQTVVVHVVLTLTTHHRYGPVVIRTKIFA